MEQRSFGAVLAALRKERGMTQLELAEKMGVTDKAVSKWERDLSYPDVSSIPKLAELFQVSVDELMQGKREEKNSAGKQKGKELAFTVLRAVALAMGVAVAALTAFQALDTRDALSMLGLGLACLAASQFGDREWPPPKRKSPGSRRGFLAVLGAVPPGPFLEEGAALTPGS